MFGFASLEDMVRVNNVVRIVEGTKAPDRGFTSIEAPPYAHRVVLGKTDAAVNKSTVASPVSGTISVWTGSSLSGLTDSGDNITAYTMFGNVGSGKFVLCVSMPFGWLICAAEC